MAIEVIRGSVTTRTYPRLQVHELGALALIIEDGRGIYLDGLAEGTAFNIKGDDRREWTDYAGSVTLHNRD